MSAVVLQMQVICYDYIAPTICWLGIVTNILNLIVLTRPQMRGSAYSFLTALAVTDMSNLLVFFTFVKLSLKAGDKGEVAYWWKIFNVYVANPGLNMFSCGSVWLITLITVDRYISVRWPLKAKFFCCRKYAHRKILSAFILAFGFNSLRFSTYKVSSGTINGTLLTSVEPTSFRNSHFYTTFVWVYNSLVMYIPSLVLIVTNSYLLIHTRKMMTQRLKLTSKRYGNQEQIQPRRDDSRLSITLIVVTFFFLLCIIPSAFSEPTIAFSIFGRGQEKHIFFNDTFYKVYVIMANLLVLSNSSINFLLYCAFNQKFSTAMREIFSDFAQKFRERFERKNSQNRHIIKNIQLPY